jgi:hypothetical protein
MHALQLQLFFPFHLAKELALAKTSFLDRGFCSHHSTDAHTAHALLAYLSVLFVLFSLDNHVT